MEWLCLLLEELVLSFIDFTRVNDYIQLQKSGWQIDYFEFENDGFVLILVRTFQTYTIAFRHCMLVVLSNL